MEKPNPMTIMHVTTFAGDPERESTRTHALEQILRGMTSFEVIHSVLECGLCGEDDHCILAVTDSPAGYMRQHICSACVEHMSRLYDQLERDFPSYALRRNEAQV